MLVWGIRTIALSLHRGHIQVYMHTSVRRAIGGTCMYHIAIKYKHVARLKTDHAYTMLAHHSHARAMLERKRHSAQAYSVCAPRSGRAAHSQSARLRSRYARVLAGPYQGTRYACAAPRLWYSTMCSQSLPPASYEHEWFSHVSRLLFAMYLNR